MKTNSSLVQVSITPYIAAHGKRPRGRGSWAFCPAALYSAPDYLSHVQWFNGLYSEAERSAKQVFAAKGIDRIVTCS